MGILELSSEDSQSMQLRRHDQPEAIELVKSSRLPDLPTMSSEPLFQFVESSVAMREEADRKKRTAEEAELRMKEEADRKRKATELRTLEEATRLLARAEEETKLRNLEEELARLENASEADETEKRIEEKKVDETTKPKRQM